MGHKYKKILVTGALGQIGSELTSALRKKYGKNNVIASDRTVPPAKSEATGIFEQVDVTQKVDVDRVVKKYSIDGIVHLAALLSANGEKSPGITWNVNVNGLLNILNIARDNQMAGVFVPSSIAVFGLGTPLDKTPNDTILRPSTMYGVTKVSGELLCNYYVQRYGLDIRGLRYPGIISSETLPGGGTTDYAVEIFYHAIQYKKYTCFLREETRLPMMYMPDCIKATLELMEAPFDRLKHHADFNLAAMNFRVIDLVREIQKHIPDFICSYAPDFRQEIADSWSNSLDDTAARLEWGWQPSFDLVSMTADMIAKLSARFARGELYGGKRAR